jgi:Protein kinase domain
MLLLQVLADKGYDGRMADVWSMGVILYVLLAGFLPFDEPSMSTLFKKIQAADFSYPRWFSEDVRSLIDAILVPDPKQRLTILQMRAHPWFAQGPPAVYTIDGSSPPLHSDSPIPSGELGGIGGASPASAASSAASLAPVVINPSAEELESAVQEGVVPMKVEGGEEQSEELSGSAPGAGGLPLAESGRGSGRRGSVRLNTFETALPPPDILSAVSAALQEMGCELRVFDASNKIKACLMTPKGMIGVVVQVYASAGGQQQQSAAAALPLHVVEVRRGKGDNLEFSKFYRDLMDSKLRHIVHCVGMEDIGASAAEEAG